RLLVTRDVLVSAFARNLSANGEVVARDLEGDVLRIDAGPRHVTPPAVLRLVHVERRRWTHRSAGWQIAPELVEETIHLTLEIEHVIERIPTGETKHREPPCLKRPPTGYIRHAWLHVKYVECKHINVRPKPTQADMKCLYINTLQTFLIGVVGARSLRLSVITIGAVGGTNRQK